MGFKEIAKQFTEGLVASRTPPLIKKASPLVFVDAPSERFGAWASSNPFENYSDYYATSVPAYRAIKLRADAIAEAPLLVYRRKSDGTPEAVGKRHPVQDLLDRMNTWWTHSDILKATETYLSIWGSAFWWVNKQGEDGPTIWPLKPNNVSIVPERRDTPDSYIAGFRYNSGRRIIDLARDEVVWFRYFNPANEFSGQSPLAPGRISLDMGKEALRFNRQFFANGAMPQDLIFFLNGPLLDEEVEAFYERLAKRHRGASKAHRPMVWDLSAGAEPKKLGLTQKEMEFLEALNFTVEDAARIWGVPPPKLYSQKQSIYNNVKQADIEFYSSTISQEWAFLASEINEMLMPIVDTRREGLFVAFDTSGILPLQEAMAEQFTRDREDVKVGLITINEVRTKRNLAPLPWGDDWWVPLGLIPTGAPGQSQQMFMPASRLAKEANPQLQYDDRTVDMITEAFSRRLDAFRREFRQKQVGIFDEQEQSVLRNLRKVKSIEKQDPLGLFDPEEWVTKSKNIGFLIMGEILSQAGAEHAAKFKLGPFDAQAPGIQAWLDKRSQFWAERTTAETARLLTQEIQTGLQAGESVFELQGRVGKVFDFSRDFRSERIARTESLVVSSQAHLEAYEQSGVVEEKMWLAAIDERTRDAHLEAHRQIVPRHGQFLVGGELLDAPGLGGDPGNNINCRCSVVPIVKESRALPEHMIEGMPSLKNGHGK